MTALAFCPTPACTQQAIMASQAASETPASSTPFTFSLTTLEVVLDVVATDRRNHPVLDLQPSEIHVFEIADGSHKLPQKITALHVIQPAPEEQPVQASASGMRVSLGGCTQRYVPHYEIAYHPRAEGLKSGYHDVLVTTNRHNVKLSFNHHYYVGETGPLAQALDRTKAEEESTLLQAACYHPASPFSIALSARIIEEAKPETASTDTEKPDALRYFITVPPDSLPFLDMSSNTRRVDLEYGICTFDADGKPLRFMRSPVDRLLTSGEYVQSIEHGFRSRLEFLPIGKPAVARVVLHDLTTGNMGSVDIPIAPIKPGELTPSEKTAEARWAGQAGKAITAESLLVFPPLGPIGSFGSLEARPGSFCGDVYELPENMTRLPNFWDLDSVGSLYTYSLDVPHQQFWNTGGIPGVTRHTDWFGIDYHGEFWIREPGEYGFELASDDGARLYIDDQEIISGDGVHMLFHGDGKVRLEAGIHTIHVPYLQGPPNAVALELFVKPPGGKLELFDLRSFAPPSTH